MRKKLLILENSIFHIKNDKSPHFVEQENLYSTIA
jgi:hypothetical protein